MARGAVTAEAYVLLSFAPGEAYQSDWRHEIMLSKGTTVTVKLAHVRLCHSRMWFVRADPRERRRCSTRTTAPVLSLKGPADLHIDAAIENMFALPVEAM